MKKEELNFEDALEQLTQITAQLERGELSLADSIEAFSEGVKLKKICEKKLKEAEQQIEILEKHGESSEPAAFQEKSGSEQGSLL